MACKCDFSRGRWGIHEPDCSWLFDQEKTPTVELDLQLELDLEKDTHHWCMVKNWEYLPLFRAQRCKACQYVLCAACIKLGFFSKGPSCKSSICGPKP